MYGKGQVSPVSFLAWGGVEVAGRRNKYTLCFGVGREVRALGATPGPSSHPPFAPCSSVLPSIL